MDPKQMRAFLQTRKQHAADAQKKHDAARAEQCVLDMSLDPDATPEQVQENIQRMFDVAEEDGEEATE